MSENLQYDRSLSKRAFQKGMLLAVGIAFVPLAFVAAGLFLSGYEPSDFSANLRVVLFISWLAYIFTVDKLANLSLWHRIPGLRSMNTGEVITVIAFAALLATMRLNPSLPRHELLGDWVRGFGLFVLVFGGLYILFAAMTRPRQRNAARKRRKVGHPSLRGLIKRGD